MQYLGIPVSQCLVLRRRVGVETSAGLPGQWPDSTLCLAAFSSRKKRTGRFPQAVGVRERQESAIVTCVEKLRRIHIHIERRRKVAVVSALVMTRLRIQQGCRTWRITNVRVPVPTLRTVSLS